MLIPGFDPYGFMQMSPRQRMVSQLQGRGLGSTGLMSVQHTDGLGYVGTLAATTAPATAMLRSASNSLPHPTVTKMAAAQSVQDACMGILCAAGSTCQDGLCTPSKAVVDSTTNSKGASFNIRASTSRMMAQTTQGGSTVPAQSTVDTSAGTNPDAAGSQYATGTDANAGDVSQYGTDAANAQAQAQQDAVNQASSAYDDGSGGGGSSSSDSTDSSGYPTGTPAVDPATAAAAAAATAALAPSDGTSVFSSIPGWAWGIGGVAVAGLAFKLLAGKR